MSGYRYSSASTAREAANWSTGRVLRSNLRAVFGRAYPRIIGLTREPSWVFFEILLPFLAVSAFVFVYRALNAPEEYIGFVVVGGAMTAFWLNVVWMMAAQFSWEKDQGNLELYFTAPMHLMSILVGMAIGGLVMTGSRSSTTARSWRSAPRPSCAGWCSPSRSSASSSTGSPRTAVSTASPACPACSRPSVPTTGPTPTAPGPARSH